MTNQVSRGRAVGVGAACVAMVMGGLGALTPAVSPGRWMVVALVVVSATALVTGATRRATRRHGVPTLVALGLVAITLVLMYGGPGGTTRLVLDGRSLARLSDTVSEAVTQANASFPPMAPSRPIEMLLVGSAVLLFLLIDLIAADLRAPAWSGLAAVAMWAPDTILVLRAPLWPFLVTAAAYLALLALTAPGSTSRSATRRERRLHVALTSRYVIVVAVAALLVAPVVARAPGWASVALPDVGSGVGGPLRLSTDLDLRADLNGRSHQVVLTYTSDSAFIGPLRVFTMDAFDGRSWSHPRTSSDALVPVKSDKVLAAKGVDADLDKGAIVAHVDVTLLRVQDVQLPITTMARSLSIDGRWSYDPARDEVIGRNATSPGTTYSMTALVPSWTATDLEATQAGSREDWAPFLAVPDTQHADDIRNLAHEVTADATSAYAKAVALQDYFRDARTFTYDTTVSPAASDDAVWDFLQGKKGYCVHFATSMTMMARMLDIPARIAVGFLPGSSSGDTYSVTGEEAHAWPELYFEGAGWVRFEPTPAIQTGSAPSWTRPDATSTTAPTPSASSEANHAPGSQAPSSAGAPQGGGSSVGDSIGTTGWWWLGGALLVLAMAAAVVLLRRRARKADLDPELAWTELRRRLGETGVRWDTSSTPRDVVRIVLDQVHGARGADLDETSADALQRLAGAVEDARYAPNPRHWDAEELGLLLATAVAGVTAAVSDRPARAGGPSAAPVAP